MAGEVVAGAAAWAVDALVLALFVPSEEDGAVLEAAALVGADFAADVLAVDVLPTLFLAADVLAADVLVAAVLAEALLGVFDEVVRDFEVDVLVTPFAGAAEEP